MLEACNVPPSEFSRLESSRNQLLTMFNALPVHSGKKELMKSQGINALSSVGKIFAETLFNELNDYGLFIVPVGELESWLPHLSITGKSTDWIVKLFSSIGYSKTDSNYLTPAADDIWLFLDKISKWVTNPMRKGII